MADEAAAAPAAAPSNGNGTNGIRAARLDLILGGVMAACLVGAIALTWVGAVYHPEAGNWQLVNDTRSSLFAFAEKIMIGYFALAMPKGR
jgi:hypothetical protein